jgi:hypothetical protein
LVDSRLCIDIILLRRASSCSAVAYIPTDDHHKVEKSETRFCSYFFDFVSWTIPGGGTCSHSTDVECRPRLVNLATNIMLSKAKDSGFVCI